MTAARDANGGVWKWLAAILAAVILAGLPGLIYATRAPTAAEVDLIRERQQLVLQRLAVIEQRLDNIDKSLQSLYEEHARLSAKLDDHVLGDVPQEIPSGRPNAGG